MPPKGRLQQLFTEDKVDSEKVYVHARKDLETDVNDNITHIGGENGTGNDHLTIKGKSS